MFQELLIAFSNRRAQSLNQMILRPRSVISNGPCSRSSKNCAIWRTKSGWVTRPAFSKFESYQAALSSL